MTCTFSAIVLSGGLSSRFQKNKSLATLLGKPMITYVIDTVKSLVDEVLVVTDTEEQKNIYSKILDPAVKFFLDRCDFKSPIVGASTGLKYAKGKKSLLLACDIPLISKSVASRLLELSEDYDAVIPRWPNGYIEPLHAAYNTRRAYAASLEAIQAKEFKMRDLIIRLKNIQYLSTNALSKLDPKLHTFLNVNTPNDLKIIKRILKSRN